MDQTDFIYIGRFNSDVSIRIVIYECHHCGALVREDSLSTHINFHNGANLEVSP